MKFVLVFLLSTTVMGMQHLDPRDKKQIVASRLHLEYKSIVDLWKLYEQDRATMSLLRRISFAALEKCNSFLQEMTYNRRNALLDAYIQKKGKMLTLWGVSDPKAKDFLALSSRVDTFDLRFLYQSFRLATEFVEFLAELPEGASLLSNEVHLDLLKINHKRKSYRQNNFFPKQIFCSYRDRAFRKMRNPPNVVLMVGDHQVEDICDTGIGRFRLGDQSITKRLASHFYLPKGAGISGTIADTLCLFDSIGEMLGEEDKRLLHERKSLVVLMPLVVLVGGYHHSILDCALTLWLNGVLKRYHVGVMADLMPDPKNELEVEIRKVLLKADSQLPHIAGDYQYAYDQAKDKHEYLYQSVLTFRNMQAHLNRLDAEREVIE